MDLELSICGLCSHKPELNFNTKKERIGLVERPQAYAKFELTNWQEIKNGNKNEIVPETE